MSERCPDCVAGYVNIVESEEPCSTCHGYARVYPAALVDQIASTLYTMNASWLDQQQTPWPLVVKAQRKVYEAQARAVLNVFDGFVDAMADGNE